MNFSPPEVAPPGGWLRRRFAEGLLLATVAFMAPFHELQARPETGTPAESGSKSAPGPGGIGSASRAPQLVLDGLLPGYGALSHGKYWQGGLILAGRVSSLYAADGYYVHGIEYDSAWRAATLADIYYGPGYHYRDPYSGGYKTTADFRHLADKNKYYSSLAMVVHAAVTVISLIYTDSLLQQDQDDRTPRFYMDPDGVDAKKGALEKGGTDLSGPTRESQSLGIVRMERLSRGVAVPPVPGDRAGFPPVQGSVPSLFYISFTLLDF